MGSKVPTPPPPGGKPQPPGPPPPEKLKLVAHNAPNIIRRGLPVSDPKGFIYADWREVPKRNSLWYCATAAEGVRARSTTVRGTEFAAMRATIELVRQVSEDLLDLARAKDVE